jgi:hypothetical protein
MRAGVGGSSKAAELAYTSLVKTEETRIGIELKWHWEKSWE